MVISKSKHLIYYCNNGFIVRNVSWKGFDLKFPAPIAIGMGGRYETPAGEYYICQKNADSRFTLFLGLSWPNIADANKAVELGSRLSASDYRRIVAANILRAQPPWDTPLGGTYGIHGAPTYMKYAIDRMEKKDPDLIYVTKRDNTRGCVAVEHRYLKFLFANVDEGTPVLIVN
ncbi:MAG: L,D-transpeptidase [Candidatus Saganbacteria bacterium]|nr:L,D-transpeptidase [Candidatus Saganbacteria bacterium]